MSTSNTKRPNQVGEKSSAQILQAPVSSLIAEPDLDWELCEQFSDWLAPELDNLVKQQVGFITPASLRLSRSHR